MPRKAAQSERGIHPIPGKPGHWRIVVSAGVDPARSTEDRKVYRQVERRFQGTLTEARAFRAKLLTEARQGSYGSTDATLNELLDAWLRELERIPKAPSTIASYKKLASRHIRPVLGSMRLATVTSRVIAEHLATLTESGLAPNSVRLVHATLSAAFSHAFAHDWVKEHPIKGKVRAPSLQNKRPIIPTAPDVVKLLDAAQRCNRPDIGVAIWLAATTGVRRGELCALRVTDFDLERGRMQVERALSGETVWTTKNRRWREVALDPATILVVEGLIESKQHRAEQEGATFRPDGYLFTDTLVGDQPWNPHIVTDTFRKLAADLDLKHIHFHSLRKFMESRALDAGFSIAEVAHRAGHDPAVLMRFYAGGVAESETKLAEAVASLLVPERR